MFYSQNRVINHHQYPDAISLQCTQLTFKIMSFKARLHGRSLTHAIEWLSYKSIDLYSVATDGLIHS